MNSSERVTMIREIKKLSLQKFADSLEISRSYLRTVESGKSEPSYRFLKSLTKAHKVNANWIINGIGKMFLGDEENSEVPTMNIDISEQLDIHKKLVAKLENDLKEAEKSVVQLKEIDLNLYRELR